MFLPSFLPPSLPPYLLMHCLPVTEGAVVTLIWFDALALVTVSDDAILTNPIHWEICSYLSEHSLRVILERSCDSHMLDQVIVQLDNNSLISPVYIVAHHLSRTRSTREPGRQKRGRRERRKGEREIGESVHPQGPPVSCTNTN